jgi:hypothetical protein
MTLEPAAAKKTNPTAKAAYCATVRPNKLGVFISLVGNESGKVRIGEQTFLNINRLLVLTPGFSPVCATTDAETVSTVLAAQESR